MGGGYGVPAPLMRGNFAIQLCGERAEWETKDRQRGGGEGGGGKNPSFKVSWKVFHYC